MSENYDWADFRKWVPGGINNPTPEEMQARREAVEAMRLARTHFEVYTGTEQ